MKPGDQVRVEIVGDASTYQFGLRRERRRREMAQRLRGVERLFSQAKRKGACPFCGQQRPSVQSPTVPEQDRDTAGQEGG